MFYSKLTSEDTVVGPGLTAGFTSTVSNWTHPTASCPQHPEPIVTQRRRTLPSAHSAWESTGPSIPTYAATAASPYIPGPSYSELISFGVSPDLVNPRIYTADLTLQRELGRGVFMEVAYNGRAGGEGF